MLLFQQNHPMPLLSRCTSSAFEEACWTLSSQLSAVLPQRPRRVLLTSALPTEGRTTVAVNLAIVLAQKGERVLLLETDLRHPTLSRQLYLPPPTPRGLAAILENNAPCVEQTVFVPEVGSFLIPAGIVRHHPMGLLGSPLMIKALETCAKNYDWVLMDSPPVCMFGDACTLGCQADGAVMIVRQYATSEAAFQTAHERLIRAGVHLFGCILNDCLYL